MRERGTGYLPEDPADPEVARWPTLTRYELGATYGRMHPMRDGHRDPSVVFDQGGTNTCVAWSLGYAMAMRARRMGFWQLNFPSVLALYAAGRSYATPAPAPLVDIGVRPSHVLRALRELGWCRTSVWPFDEALVNERPPLDVWQSSIDARIMEIMIETHTEPGEWVCDPFAGSGVTAHAARALGRKFILVEEDAAEFEKMRASLA